MQALRRLAGNSILRSMAGVGSFAVLGNLLVLLAAPLLSRLFTADAFGLFGLFFAFANVLAAVAMLGLQDAIFATSEEEELLALFKSALLFALLSGPLAAFVCWLFIAADLFGLGVLPGWTALLMAIEVPAVTLIILLQLWHVRRQQFRTLAFSHLALGGARAGGQVSAGFAGLGFLGLGAAEAASRIVTASFLAMRARDDLARARRVTPAACRAATMRARRFILFRTPSTFAFNLGTALPPAIVNMTHGIGAAGLYAFTYSILVVPAGLVQKAAGDVFLGHFAELHQADPDAARRLLLRTLVTLTAIAIPPALLLALAGEPLFAFVFGEQWREAGRFASLMAPMLIVDVAIGPLGVSLNVVNRPELKLIFDIARITASAAAYGLTVALDASMGTTVQFIAWFGAASYVIYLALILYATRRPRPAQM